MVTFYFDTSAIVKRYRKEVGSDILDKIFEFKEHGLAVSFWSLLEFTVAFSAKMRRKDRSIDLQQGVVSLDYWTREASRWLQDALEDLNVAKILLESGHCSSSCFHSQQAAEKAVKASLY